MTSNQFRHALGVEMINADVDLLPLKGIVEAANLNSVRRSAKPSETRLREVDQRRAQEARGGQHREMVAGDFEAAKTTENIVNLSLKRA